MRGPCVTPAVWLWLLGCGQTAAPPPEAPAIADTAQTLADVAADGPTADAADTAGAAAVDVAAEASAGYDPCAADPVLANPPQPPLHTPRWAFEPWISKDISTGDDTRAFVSGFRDRDIPVGVVVLDSPWETNYNTFVANPNRYADFPKLVSELHAKNVRVVVWLTAMVNDASIDLEPGGDSYDGPAANFAEGKACGHFVNDAATYSWWKGTGAAVDFFSPAARTWWNRQQIELLKHVDGYKLDFGEMYIGAVPMQTAAGAQTLDAYSQAYYREMLAFGVAQKGPGNFVTMVRPWDESYGFPGRFFAKKEHAPVAWVGDNRRDWVGLVDALDEMFISAAAGYTVVGSDVGGYLDRDDVDLLKQIPFDPINFARWVAIGALGPFMELHGRGNFTPWTVPAETAAITAAYKYWASWHHQFAPMLYEEVRLSQLGQGPLVMQPIGTAATWPGDWRYLLGRRWLVAPLTDATGKRAVALPAGKSWLDWWHLEVAPLPGGSTVTVDLAGDLLRLPLFLDACSVQPFVDGTQLTGLAPGSVGAHEGWLITAAMTGCKPHQATGTATDGAPLLAQVTPTGGSLQLTVSRSTLPTILVVRPAQKPTKIKVDGVDIGPASSNLGAGLGWQSDASGAIAYIRLPTAAMAAGKTASVVVE